MKAFSIFVNSFKQSGRSVRLITWVWLGTMMTALPGCWSAYSILKNALGQTGVPGEWLKGFDFTYLSDLFNQQTSMPTSFFSMAFALVVLGIIAYVILTGGIVGWLHERSSEVITFREFLGFGGKFFGPFFGIFFLTAALTAISLVFTMIPKAGIPLTILAAALWIMNGDVLKIRFANGDHKWFKTYFSTIGWTIRHIPQLAVLYILNLIILGLGFVLYRLIDLSLNPNGWLLVIVTFIVQQGFVFVRAMVKVNVLTCVQHAWDEWKPVHVATPELSQMPLEIPPAEDGLTQPAAV